MRLRDLILGKSRKRYALDFAVYQRHDLPEEPGIYCVYSASFRRSDKVYELLYIGKADRLWSRVDKNRQDWKEWERFVNAKQGQTLRLTAAHVPRNHLRRVESAMIYQHKPRFNKKSLHSFRHPRTTVSTGGKNYLLEREFTVGEP